MSETDQTRLIRWAQEGDTAAFDNLVRLYQNRIVAYASCLLRSRDLAEDAAQEAFLQAWRDVPALREPAAFAAWIRTIVFKHCDRIRRRPGQACISLDAAFHIAGGPEPERLAESSADAWRIRDAIDALPDRERETSLVYYLGDRDIAATAEFLGLTPSTVKKRLFAARKRLRKDLWEMAEAILEKEKPARDEVFAGNVLARIAGEFRRQMRADPHTADRKLLDRGHVTLNEALGQPGALDWETVRAGFDLLLQQDDWTALTALLTRYLAQPLDSSHTFWAYYHLANAFTVIGSSASAAAGAQAGAVLAHETLERLLPEMTARISADWPHAPHSDDEKGKYYESEGDLRLLALARSSHPWRWVWRGSDHLAKVDAALGACVPTADNRDLRFGCLRMAGICAASLEPPRESEYIAQMYGLAKEPGSPSDQANWRVKAMGHEMARLRNAHDDAGFDRVARDREALLAAAKGDWVRGERHDHACELAFQGRADLALPLFEQNLADGGHVNAWGYLIHAAVLYGVTGNRERSLGLIREAAARGARDLTELFRGRPEFAGVHDDPEFLAAVAKPGQASSAG